VTNLNRQFLFRQKDVGSSKAQVAAEFINTRMAGSGVVVTPHHGKIQDFDAEFYSEFNVIVSGLDNVEARRWLNATLVGMVEFDEDGNVDGDTIVPLVDGGTEGFKGQARVILPTVTSCFECSLDSFPPQTTYAVCTVASTPRRPEHCIAYTTMILWKRTFGDRKLDTDSPEDMRWCFDRALERAEEYGIEGVTYRLTMGVVKNIIPAIASTNAIIAAACVSEALKLVTYGSQTLNNYMMYNGTTGLYAHTFEYGKKEDCLVCGADAPVTITVASQATCQDLLDHLKEHATLRLTSPSVTNDGTPLFMSHPPALRRQLEPNLTRTLKDLGVESGTGLIVVDPGLPAHKSLTIDIRFSDDD
jgi:ubiquitin-activating enzyme E1 C